MYSEQKVRSEGFRKKRRTVILFTSQESNHETNAVYYLFFFNKDISIWNFMFVPKHVRLCLSLFLHLKRK